MKKTLASALVMSMLIFTLAACGAAAPSEDTSDGNDVQDGSGMPDDSGTSQPPPTSEQESGNWYDNGCYIECISTYGAGPEAPGVVTDGKKYYTELKIYYDGTKLLCLEKQQDDASGSRLYEKSGDEIVLKSSVSSSGAVLNKTTEKSYRNGDAGDYFFDEDKYGAHINDGQKMSLYAQGLYLFTKTDRKDTVSGRSCTIYEKVNESDASYTIEKWVDDELGIILKTRDKFSNAFDDYIWFEVQVLELEPRTMPEVDFGE